MMAMITFAFLAVALAAYVLFGGADFGGGQLEASLWRHDRLRDKLQATLAPIWEANHVWLIAVIVILFVGFPVVYARLCTHLFVPLSLALLGIILRGAFFTFRKYDPEPERRMALHAILFRASSFLTPTMFGFMAAAVLHPFPVVAEGASFASMYVAPWLTWTGAWCALFVNGLFAYLAAVFFYGEVDRPEDRVILRRRIGIFFAVAFLCGGMVLWLARDAALVAPDRILTPFQIANHLLALGGIAWMVIAIRRDHFWQMRLAAGLQTLAILANWHHIRFPVLLSFTDGAALTVANSAAPRVTLLWLNIGLTGVLAAVLPLLAYLYLVFQGNRADPMTTGE
jgi:cytochrome bd ubiquinol oxidase subunit II